MNLPAIFFPLGFFTSAFLLMLRRYLLDEKEKRKKDTLDDHISRLYECESGRSKIANVMAETLKGKVSHNALTGMYLMHDFAPLSIGKNKPAKRQCWSCGAPLKAIVCEYCGNHST